MGGKLDTNSRVKERLEWEKTQPMLEGESTLLYKIRLKREWEKLQQEDKDNQLQEYSAYIPELDLERDLSGLSPEQKALDDMISLITIADAYNRWANKGTVSTRGRKDSIKVRCPNPQHPDNNPSAWLNTEKNVYYCGSCAQGGDIWDIAAYYFGFSVPGYKKDAASFRLLREKIGEHLGVYITKGIAGDVHLTRNESAESQKSEVGTPNSNSDSQTSLPERTESTSGETTGHSSVSNVSYTPEGAAEEEEKLEQEVNANRKHPQIDWRTIVPENTFLREYLDAVTLDDSPEEFHFWNGLVAVGMSAGRARTLEDLPLVSPNLYVCLVGASGTGKSKSRRYLVEVLQKALPYSRTDQPPTGVLYASGIQSGEVLVKMFQHEIIDPGTNKPIGFWPNIRVLADFDELASLMGRSSRMGSTLKTVLMELFDSPYRLGSLTMSHGNIEAEQPFGSCTTTTQYKSIRDLITKKDDASGFANRWVYATGVPKKQFSVNRLKVDLEKASGMLAGLGLSYRTHETITWSDEGEKEWDEYFHNTLLPHRKAADATILQRLDLIAKKLFLLFAMNERSSTISGDIVKRVLTIMPHLLETYGVVEQEIAATEEGDFTELILRQVERLTMKNLSGGIKRGPTATEIFRSVKHKISSTTVVRKTLENLVVLGLIEEQKIPPGPKGGRPTSAYCLPSAV
jgi:hypothetical protein